MDVNVNINLPNVLPSSEVGEKLQYIINCLQQLSSLYPVVNNDMYKNSLNDCLLAMVTFIEQDNIPQAIDEFDIDIDEIQVLKQTFFNQYMLYFFNQYSVPLDQYTLVE
jgi:hypothetical protein